MNNMGNIIESSGWDTVYPYYKHDSANNCDHEILLVMRGDSLRLFGVLDVKCLNCHERFIVTRRELLRQENHGRKVIYRGHDSHVDDADFYQPYFMAHHAIYPRIKHIYGAIKKKRENINENEVYELPTSEELLAEIFQNVIVDNLYSDDWVPRSLDYIDKKLTCQKEKTMHKSM